MVQKICFASASESGLLRGRWALRSEDELFVRIKGIVQLTAVNLILVLIDMKCHFTRGFLMVSHGFSVILLGGLRQ